MFVLGWRKLPDDSSCVLHTRSLVLAVGTALTTEAVSSSVIVARVGAGQGDGSDGR